ncbi:radial spoke head 1 homolog [Pholidichthys leucotaenia]
MSDTESEDLENDKVGSYVGGRNEEGARHGFGKAVLSTGDVYEGVYENGRKHGQGTYRFKNGARYVGNYFQNKKHGQGTFFYPDGSKYEGSWVEDLRQGHGVYTYSNGDTYDGEWLQHKRHGQGVYHHKDTGAKYKGPWVNGEMDSAGEYIYTNFTYKGNFIKSQPYGDGKFVFDIGCEQHGQYYQMEQEGTEDEDEFREATATFLRWIPKCITDLTSPTPGNETCELVADRQSNLKEEEEEEEETSEGEKENDF